MTPTVFWIIFAVLGLLVLWLGRQVVKLLGTVNVANQRIKDLASSADEYRERMYRASSNSDTWRSRYEELALETKLASQDEEDEDYVRLSLGLPTEDMLIIKGIVQQVLREHLPADDERIDLWATEVARELEKADL